MGSLAPSDTRLYKSSSAHDLVCSSLAASGVDAHRAGLVAHALVLADLRGVDTHGINRLPGYVARIRNGALSPNPQLEFEMKTPVMATLDAKDTFGFIAASMAVDKGIQIASQYGIAAVAVKHSSHYGMASTYLLRAIEKGFAAFAFTNASPSMPLWGSKQPFMGTSPFAVGFPGGTEGSFVLDMSPSVAARGKLRKAARRGESIPEGYALDCKGQPTTDPDEALKGTVLPIGGPKGSGIAMMMDIMGGVMTGAAFKGDVVDMNKPGATPQNVGHWFLIFRPDVFLESNEEYSSRMDELLAAARQTEKAQGVQRIFTSGEIESEKEAHAKLSGIPYTLHEVKTLHDLADELGCRVRLELVN